MWILSPFSTNGIDGMRQNHKELDHCFDQLSHQMEKQI